MCILFALILAGCGTTPATATVEPTPTPVERQCLGAVCIQRVFLVWEDDNDIRVHLDVTDRNGEVNIGNQPELEDDLIVGLFDKDDEYLWGGEIPRAGYFCYTGNDVPWSHGKLAVACSFALPVREFQIRPEVGDELRVEVLRFDYVQNAEILDELGGD